MAFELSTKAKLLVEQTGLHPNLILKIDGIDEIFGLVEVSKLIRIGDPDLLIDGSWVIGGVSAHEDSRPWVSLNKTTKNFTQQLLQDKGGSSSITNMTIEIIDKNNELTEILEPSNRVADPLSSPAKVYLGMKEGAYPEEYIEIFSGVVEAIDAGMSSYTISVGANDTRREIFIESTSLLNGAIDNAVTTIPLISTVGLIEISPELRGFIRLDDEIIEYTGISGNDLTGCIRGSLNTIPLSHDDQAESSSFYELSGKPIETALKVMLSDGEGLPIETGLAVESVNYISPTIIIDGAYFFQESNIEKRLGLVVGDLISVTGTLSDFTDEPITGFGVNELGSYILVAPSSRPNELTSSGQASIKSKYNTLPTGAGLGLRSDQVDIEGMEFVNTLFGSAFPTYSIFIKETVSGQEFLEEELFFPSGLYSLPRKGRTGVGYTAPPLAIEEVKTLDESNIVNPEKLRVRRSTNKWFYNNIIFKYELDSLDDRFLANKVTLSSESVDRIRTGNKSMIIESKGLRNNPVTDNLIERVTRNLLNRYQFAADFIPDVEILPNVGFNIEVGDVLVFGSENLQLADNSSGSRKWKPRLMEVTAKKLDVTTMRIRLSLIDSSFGLDSRFAVISCSSNVDSGSTLDTVILKQSYSTADGVPETNKWQDYEDQPIVIRSIDWSFEEVRRFEIHPTIPNAILLDSPLSSAPLEDFIVDVATYDESSQTFKTLFGYIDPTVLVDSSASTTQFDVPVGEEVKFFSDGFIRVHNQDFSNDSGQVKILDVTGQTITCEDLSFTPSNGDQVNLIGFYTDEGLPYVML